MKSVEVSAKTVDEAIELALQQLKADKEDVEIEVLEKGSKGFLNLIGVKEAKVRVTVQKNYVNESQKFLIDVLDAMNVEADVVANDNGDNIDIELLGKNMGILIGYRGETLDALQYLTSLAINKGNHEKYKRVVLDTQNYRNKRAEILKSLAIKKAKKVRMYNKSIKLEPMNPYERRIIHSALQGDEFVRTYSEGEEPYRRVVIELKKKKA